MRKLNISYIRFLIILIICSALSCSIYDGISSYFINNNNKIFIIKNHNTRNYDYEHYCDSIYEVNPNYYLDVLIETDKFQNYIDEHGEWWTN